MEIRYRNVRLIETKAMSKPGSFVGYGAVFGNVDSYGDIIEPGAFTCTLQEWKEERGKLPKMLLQHGGWGITAEDLLPIGRWTHMEEDAKGLRVEGQLFGMNTERGQLIYEGLHSGELDGLSIGFDTIDDAPGTTDGEPVRYLKEIDLWEVSLVTFPANNRALVSTVKHATREQWIELRHLMIDEGMGETESFTAVSAIKEWFQNR